MPINSNLIITFSIISALITSFSIIYVINDIHRSEYSIEKIRENWYDDHLSTNENEIFIMGASHVWALNSTHIEKNLFNLGYEYQVNNLGIAGEQTVTQLDYVEKVISKDPDMIIMSIPYVQILSSKHGGPTIFPLNNNSNENNLSIPIEIGEYFQIEKIKGLDLLNFKNPKLTSLQLIDRLSGKSFVDYNFGTQEPFTWTGVNEPIRDNNQLKKKVEFFPSRFYEAYPNPNSANVQALKKIVNIYKENGIKLIVFVPPFHELFWEKIDQSKKVTFLNIVKNLESELDIEIYDFHDKYSDKQIWFDILHVARNSDSLIFADDMTTIIEQELKS